MDRSNFGFWGLGLSSEEFAKALAAFGVLFRFWRGWPTGTHVVKEVEGVAELLRVALEREKPFALWPRPIPLDVWQSILADDKSPSAAVMAQAWERVKDSFWPRLELVVGEEEPFWLVEELSRDEVGARSVYVRVDEPAADIGWNWPIEVGFLGDPESQSLRRAIETRPHPPPWMQTLVRLVSLESAQDACDLLLVPLSARAALASVLQSAFPVRADCVIILEKLTDPPQQSFAVLKALRAQAGIAGVAQAYVPPATRLDWLVHLIRELSHNFTLDVALRAATRYSKGARLPVLIASRRLVEFSYVAQHLFRLADRFERREMADRRVTLDPGTADSLNLGNREAARRRYDLRSVARHIRLNHEKFRLISEEDTASASVELGRLADEAPSPTKAAPEPPQLRWIQAKVYDATLRRRPLGLSGKVPPGPLVRDAMRPGTPYLVRVHIGPQTESSVPTELPPIDEAALPPSATGHELTVVFTAPGVLPEPQVASILLPRLGPSNECEFRVLVGEGFVGDSFEARIIVLHANRVLQTALLAVPVKRRGVRLGVGIRLLPEVVVRTNLDELGGAYRQPFDGVLLLNHNKAGLAGVTKIAGKKAGYIGLQDEKKSVEFFHEKLSAIVQRPEKYKKLKAAATTNLLRQCAVHGYALHDAIFGYNTAALDAVVEGRRIQVIAARVGAQLPVEFLYDRPSPDDDAEVCGGSERALADGECPHTCPPPGQGQRVICPLGFWGLSRVIERHLHDQQRRLPSDYAIQSEPVRSRRHLDLFARGLFAASKNVDAEAAGSSKRVSSKLSQLTHANSARVETWDDWVTEVKKNSPPLLILIPHTVEAGARVPGLEISTGQKLSLNALDRQHVRGSVKVPPVVVLMGCGTDAPDIGYHSFPLKFIRGGAAIVIGTGATIIGEHAAPVTEELLDQLAAAAAEARPRSFGEVMLRVRQTMVAHGLPMALCLTAYGDTDWLVSKPK